MKKKTKCCGYLKKCFSILIGIIMIILFILTPMIIFRVFQEEKYLGFLGGYVGAILTLGGVWFQIQRLEKYRKNDESKREKERKLGILKYLKFVLNENINIGEKEGFIYYIQKKLFYQSSVVIHGIEPKIFKEFSSNYLENNLNVIMDLKNNIGEELLELNYLCGDVIINYNNLLKVFEDRKNFFRNASFSDKTGDEAMKVFRENHNKMENSIKTNLTPSESEETVWRVGKMMHKEFFDGITKLEKKDLQALLGHTHLDMKLNAKGFEIVDKSKELLGEVKEEINRLG